MGFLGRLFGKKSMDDEIEEYNRQAEAREQGAPQSRVKYTVNKTSVSYSSGDVPANMRGNIVSSSAPQTRKTTITLRTDKAGGYDTAQTLMLINALNAELVECTNAKNTGAPMPPRTQLPMPPEVSKNGFNKQDADTMISELKNMIELIRSGS